MKDWKNNKQLWVLAGLAILGIILMLYNPGGSQEDTQENKAPGEVLNRENESNKQETEGMSRLEKEMASNLEEMLKKISGAGEVSVAVRLASSPYSKYAFNTDSNEKTTEEQDQSGGTRTTTETNEREEIVVIQEQQGNETPVINREIASNIAGVLVIAEGAGDAGVKARLFEAVKVSMGVEPHKILVLSMERSE